MKKSVILSTVFLLMFVPAFGGTRTLNLNKCIQLALAKNQTIDIAKRNLWIKKSSMRAAKYDYLLPSFDFSSTYTRLDPKTVDRGLILGVIPTVFADNISAGFSVNYPLFTFFRLQDSYNISKIDVQLAMEGVRATKKKIKISVMQAFFQVLLMKKKYLLVKANFNRLKKYYKIAGENYKAGRLSKFQLLSSQVRFENTKPQLFNSLNQIKIAKIWLARIVGLNFKDQYKLKGQLKKSFLTMSEEKAYQIAKAKRIELKKYILNIKKLNLMKKHAVASKMPSINAFFSYQWSLNKLNIYEVQNRQFTGNWTAGIQLSLPLSSLLPWSRARETEKQISMKIVQTKKRKILFDHKLKSIILQTILNLKTSKNTIETQMLTVSLASERLKLANAQFRRGQIAYNILMNAEADYQKAENILSQSWFNYNISETNLLFIIGLL